MQLMSQPNPALCPVVVSVDGFPSALSLSSISSAAGFLAPALFAGAINGTRIAELLDPGGDRSL